MARLHAEQISIRACMKRQKWLVICPVLPISERRSRERSAIMIPFANPPGLVAWFFPFFTVCLLIMTIAPIQRKGVFSPVKIQLPTATPILTNTSSYDSMPLGNSFHVMLVYSLSSALIRAKRKETLQCFAF